MILGEASGNRLAEASRYFLGEGAQVFVKLYLEVAAVCKPEINDSQCFAELVASNRRVNLRGYSDLPSAEEWLLK